MPRKNKKEYTYYEPTALQEKQYITLTDIKNWIYCPKIVYYHRVLKIKPKTEKTQEKGKQIHQEETIRILRRKGIKKYEKTIYILKQGGVELKSEKLKLKGIIDIIAINQHNEIFPIEIKYMKTNKGKPWLDHRYQIIAEALLIEENYHKPVKKGYIYYTKEQKLIKITITTTEKQYTKHLINKIHQTIKQEKEPKTKRKKCSGGCGYKWICNQ